jgi:hypothetical protein
MAQREEKKLTGIKKATITIEEFEDGSQLLKQEYVGFNGWEIVGMHETLRVTALTNLARGFAFLTP